MLHCAKHTVAQLGLNCATLSAQAKIYADEHGYCGATVPMEGSTAEVIPENSVGGSRGTSDLYVWDNGWRSWTGSGMIWSVSDARFEAGLDWARVWAKGHGGSLAVPARASIGGYAIGTWLSELRAAVQVPPEEQGALDPDRRRALEEIDPWWCPAWPIAWQRAYSVARSWWLESDGRVDWPALPLETLFEGQQLCRWALAQRAGFPGLEEDQQDLLTAIGIEEDPELVAAKAAAEAKPAVSRTDRFAQGVAALAAFDQEHGHPRVPHPHKQPLETAEAGPDGETGSWCSTWRSAPGSTTRKPAGRS